MASNSPPKTPTKGKGKGGKQAPEINVSEVKSGDSKPKSNQSAKKPPKFEPTRYVPGIIVKASG